MLGMESGEIMQSIEKTGPGDRIKTALFYGATRKHHARDFPNVFAVDAFMDDLADAKEDAEDGGLELEFELLASLMSAYMRTDKKAMLKRFRGEPDEAPEPGALAESSGSEEAPKAPVKPSKKSE